LTEQTQNFPTTMFARPAPPQAGLGSLLRRLRRRFGAKLNGFLSFRTSKKCLKEIF